ncbi:MAG TPA: hydroxymethylbilane synthase [Solirubrobacterales bacterium]|nr:hydroxymethylbilane synthase [Solirubrobacterales bacterium]
MIRIATRSSALAKAQAGQVAALLGGAELVECSSDGEPGDKARFVRGVERALLEGEAEIGVHSAKDVPAEMPAGLVIAAVPVRESAVDVWIGARSSAISRQTRPGSLDDVEEGARVGTASLRRRAQLLAARPDLEVGELHGNVDTRLRKLADGEFDAIVLAGAGLRRLGREDEASFELPAETMTPAAGQGALVLQARSEDTEAVEAAAAIGDEVALRELTAERAVVALLDATCATPIGVHARVESTTGEGSSADGGDRLLIEAFVGLPDGSEWIRDRVEGDASEPAAAGALLAERLLGAGAREILDRAEAVA